MTAVSEDYNPQLALDQAVDEAFAAEGYITQDGKKDTAKLREVIFTVLEARKVTSKSDLAGGPGKSKAVTRGEMVTEVFPSLPGPEDFDDAEDPQLALAVWKKIDSYLYGEVKTSAGSPMQRLVGLNMGNGYVLCRTVIGKDRTSAVYITDNLQLIELDYVTPANEMLRRALERAAADRELLVLRQPQHAKRFVTRWDQHMAAITAAGHARLSAALEASAPAEDEGTGA